MYRKVSLSSFHNGKIEYCAIFGSGDIEENASVIFLRRLYFIPQESYFQQLLMLKLNLVQFQYPTLLEHHELVLPEKNNVSVCYNKKDLNEV